MTRPYGHSIVVMLTAVTALIAIVDGQSPPGQPAGNVSSGVPPAPPPAAPTVGEVPTFTAQK